MNIYDQLHLFDFNDDNFDMLQSVSFSQDYSRPKRTVTRKPSSTKFKTEIEPKVISEGKIINEPKVIVGKYYKLDKSDYKLFKKFVLHEFERFGLVAIYTSEFIHLLKRRLDVKYPDISEECIVEQIYAKIEKMLNNLELKNGTVLVIKRPNVISVKS